MNMPSWTEYVEVRSWYFQALNLQSAACAHLQIDRCIGEDWRLTRLLAKMKFSFPGTLDCNQSSLQLQLLYKYSHLRYCQCLCIYSILFSPLARQSDASSSVWLYFSTLLTWMLKLGSLIVPNDNGNMRTLDTLLYNGEPRRGSREQVKGFTKVIRMQHLRTVNVFTKFHPIHRTELS